MNKIYLNINQESYPDKLSLRDIFLLSLIKDCKMYGPTRTAELYPTQWSSKQSVNATLSKLEKGSFIYRTGEAHVGLTERGEAVFVDDTKNGALSVLNSSGLTTKNLSRIYDAFLGPDGALTRSQENKNRVLAKLSDLFYKHKKIMKEISYLYKDLPAFEKVSNFNKFVGYLADFSLKEFEGYEKPALFNNLNLHSENNFMFKFSGWLYDRTRVNIFAKGGK